MENTGTLKFRGGSNRHHVTVKGLLFIRRLCIRGIQHRNNLKLNKYTNYSVFDIIFETNVCCFLNPPPHVIIKCICWQFYAVAGPENSWNSFTDVVIRYRYLSMISIVHWIEIGRASCRERV